MRERWMRERENAERRRACGLLEKRARTRDWCRKRTRARWTDRARAHNAGERACESSVMLRLQSSA
eukprot:1621127-Pleurochrysis_carterae.AAC.1